MRLKYWPILCCVLGSFPLAASTLTPPTAPVKAGETATIAGTDLGGVTEVVLKAGDKTLKTANLKAKPNSVAFDVPATASGDYEIALTPAATGSPVHLTVTPKPQPSPDAAVAPPATAEKPVVIDSVFPTTTYPVNDRFNFEINGQNFDADPTKDQIEVEGQGVIPFGSWHRTGVSQPAGAPGSQPASAVECAQESPQQYPCLEASADGRRLSVIGFPRRFAFQGPLRVRVQVKGTPKPSEYSSYFTLSRVNHRVIVWLTFAFFGLLMYIVYRLVSSGVQGYTIAGQKYGPLRAFFIDKSTDSYSLSKFQLFAFSMVSFFAYMYVFLCRTLVQWHFTFPDIPENYPSLLAISAGTTAAAAGLTSTRGTKGGGPVHPSPADFISAGGLVVAERFQFFVWTLIACLGFVALVLMQDPAKVDGFPAFPSGLLYVMGVSAAGYLGGKAVRNPGPILKKVDVSATAPPGAPAPDPAAAPVVAPLYVTLTGENLDPKATFRIDNELQTTTGLPTGPQQLQAPTGYSTVLTLTLSQAAQFAQGDHVFEIVNADGIGAQAVFTATPMKIRPANYAIGAKSTGTVALTVEYYREGSSARWLAPGASDPIDIPAASVTSALVPAPARSSSPPTSPPTSPPPSTSPPAPGAPPTYTVTVTVTAGENTGIGTLTLVAPRGGTEATSVTVT